MNALRCWGRFAIAGIVAGASTTTGADLGPRTTADGKNLIIFDFPTPMPVGEPQITTSVVLRNVVDVYSGAPTPRLPVMVPPGTHVKLSLPVPDAQVTTVFWSKDGVRLNVPETTLDIPAARAADVGVYTAAIFQTNGRFAYFEYVYVQVESPTRQRLLNFSTRGTISAAQKFFISGFVVSPTAGTINATRLILIRAIGPSLAGYGVTDALADPEIHVFKQDGTELSPPVTVATFPGPFDGIPAKVGAFPIPTGTKDITVVYTILSGVYSVRVSSAGGGSGTVLLEIYEFPD